MEDFPFIPPELLEVLEERYPNRAPRLSKSDREIWFEAGQADLVQTLKLISEEQSKTILEGQ